MVSSFSWCTPTVADGAPLASWETCRASAAPTQVSRHARRLDGRQHGLGSRRRVGPDLVVRGRRPTAASSDGRHPARRLGRRPRAARPGGTGADRSRRRGRHGARAPRAAVRLAVEHRLRRPDPLGRGRRPARRPEPRTAPAAPRPDDCRCPGLRCRARGRSPRRDRRVHHRPGSGSSGPPVVYVATRVAMVTAVVVTASPHLARPWRYASRVVLCLGAVAAIGLGATNLIGASAAIAVGIGAAAVAHLVLGSPQGRLTDAQVLVALADLGVPATRVTAAPGRRRRGEPARRAHRSRHEPPGQGLWA